MRAAVRDDWRAKVGRLLPVALLAVLAGGTYWLLQRALPTEKTPAARARMHVPDSFADRLSVTSLSEKGQPVYRLTADHMIRYEDTQVTEIQQPALRSFTPGEPEVTVTAQRGTVSADQAVIDLYDQAHVVRDAAPDAPEMQALSEHFRVLVNDDVVETEKPVKLLRGPSVTNASGMVYNNVTRQLRLLGQVRGSIAAAEFNGGARPRATANQ
ncbi:LPS export ABC transporter periplasmic protein LptC [Chitinasiproducens palmae]|uniref:LPS export ABC transporter periplasmic protein LptC n=1 Tax=Chitinasiproducens palmae TaxID=1770053 RepID=UPI001F23DAC2|nr:LPS export ABC transporter periplasmic protein LptC [Chitinasiproducens palmae]